jgi:zinc transport system substrate-binding protein
MKSRLLLPLLSTPGALLAGGGLTGCAAFSDDPAGGDGVQVAAAFYPLQYVAERVTGDLATAENLTQPGAEPHDMELTIGQTAAVAEADLVVHESGFEPAVDAAVEQNATGEVLDAATVVDLEGDDPHFWLDPARMAALGDEVAGRLAEIDPDHADDYAANADDLRADLEALDSAYRSGLADCERTTVVVSHDAFGYLAKYGLDMEPIAGLSPEAEPTPRDLARLQELIRTEGITTVFAERLAPRQLTETLAADLGIVTAVLDPLEGLDDETADEDYLSLMEQNLAALQKANDCR